MRGKLRDKRAPKRDVFKRETVDRKRSVRHNTRVAPWFNQEELDEQEDELLDESNEEDAEEETVITILPQPQPQKK